MCMSRKINHLIEFLNKNYKVGKNDDCTNTSMSNGKWNIQQEDYPVFLSEYCKYIKTQTSHDDIHLIERHNEYSPIIIDLDFRFGKDEIKRKYEKSQITSLINIYQQQIVKDLDIEPVAFVFEREEPYISRGIVKDGVHIMFPFVITKPEYQHYLRDKVLEKCDEVIEEITCTNDKKDIIDKSVIYSNGWFMYGSCKPGQKPYKLTSIYGNNVVEINKEEFSGFDETKLPSILSIRNKLEPTQFKREVNLENYDKSRGYIKRKHINKNITKVNLEDLHTVEKLINILDVKRADNYDYWIKLGMCLHNIDYKLLYNWIEFSKKSSKFDSEGSCEMKWNSFDNSTSSKKIQIGSLHHWAKEDNQIEYEKIISEDIQQFIVNNIKGQGNHSDIASVVYKMFGDKFVCSNIKHKAWWEFKYHRWHQIDQGITLRRKISKDLVDEFFKLQKRYAEQILSTEDEEIRNNIQSKCECIFKIVDKLKNATFKDSVMKECMEVFYICKFEEKLDSKDELICFNNGIYNLKEGLFRDGNPEDFISLCTYVDYIPYNCLDNNTRNVESFMKKIFPDKEVREYVYKYLSCCLEGGNNIEKFHILYGVGSNGKSKLIELLEGCFGEYSCKIPISVITQKRIGAGQADPFLARTKGKRFVSFDEPNKEDKINPGLMKNLTGGDKIATRGLFRDPIEFKPAFKPLLVCNHLPNVPSEDQGTWRRIVGIELKSRFTENPNPNNKNEFKVDRRLAGKIEKWHSGFMSILIEKYKNYIKNGLEPPIEIINFTSKYRQDVDFFFEFLNDNTEKDNMSSINMRLLYGRFKDWFKNNDMDGKCPKKKELDQYIEERYEVSNGNLLKYKLLNHLNTLTTEQVESLYGGSSTGESSKGTIHSESDGASVVSSSNVSTCSSVSLLDFNNNKIRLSNYDMNKTYIKLTGKEMKKKSGLTAERLDLYKKNMNLTVKEMRDKIIPNWPKRQNCLAHSDHLRNDIKLGYIVLIPNNIIEL